MSVDVWICRQFPNARFACRRNVSGLEEETGAGEGIRTLDPDLGKVVLYP
jgi:hypothetical protein